MKTLVLYVFHIYNERVQHFIDKAIFKDDNVDFMIICNNLEINLEKYNIPDYVICMKRNNIGFDFGGWSEALITNNFYKNYDYFIFVNSSVLGPYLPKKFKGKWTDIYINGLTSSVRLFGSTIHNLKSVQNLPHVQSYIFAMDKEIVEYLIMFDVFSITNYTSTLYATISSKEIFMSMIILQKWNIGCLLPCYKNVNFIEEMKNTINTNLSPELYQYLHNTNQTDLCYNKFYNKLWTETDVIFIKGNRDIIINPK